MDKKIKPYYRTYKDYSEYVEQQKSKLKTLEGFLPAYDKEYFKVLVERLKQSEFIKQGMNVLCLGARVGTEVKSFIDLNCFAVGIDLITSENNKYVLHGDFHYIQFPQNSVDIVFTNSLDHVFNLNKVLDEIKRVLKSGGYFITEMINYNVGIGDKYTSFFWSNIDDILDIIINSGFKLIKKINFIIPWKGEHCIFQNEN